MVAPLFVLAVGTLITAVRATVEVNSNSIVELVGGAIVWLSVMGFGLVLTVCATGVTALVAWPLYYFIAL